MEWTDLQSTAIWLGIIRPNKKILMFQVTFFGSGVFAMGRSGYLKHEYYFYSHKNLTTRFHEQTQTTQPHDTRDTPHGTQHTTGPPSQDLTSGWKQPESDNKDRKLSKWCTAARLRCPCSIISMTRHRNPLFGLKCQVMGVSEQRHIGLQR